MDFQAAKYHILAKLEKELPKHLSYHSKDHTVDVLQATQDLCVAEKVTEAETILLCTAALFHDAGFLISAEQHEMHSCNMARVELPYYNYPKDQIEEICQLIMATDLTYKPQNHLEYILRDADLDYLGRDDYFIIAESLYQEMTARGIQMNRAEWKNMQVNFLENHSFFTPTSIAKREVKKGIHLATIKKNLEV